MKQQGFFEDQTDERLQSMKQGISAMLVVLRIRPLTSKQSSINQTQCLKPFDKKLVTLIDTEDGDKKRSKQTQFSFDFVYSKEVTTKKIYDQCLSGFLGGVLQGFNAAILAYGATGCGKTHTMIGDINNEGICALSLIDLLGRTQQLKATHHVALRLSYIEIYNEVIKDILVSEDKSLQLREDPKEGVQVIGATEVPITSFLQLATLLKVGTANRSKQSTSLNEASSRSHGLLLIKVQTKQKAQSTKEQVLIGKLSLVDLAGSQKATGGKNQRQLQGSKINKSLLVLGNCIQILSERNGKHIPYRQSKLTRILKEALGGNCRTIMLACVSPFSGNREQTYNTLVYASRARNIDSHVTRNVQNSEAHLSSYIALISNLKKENEDLKRQLKSNKNYSLPHLKIANSSQIETERLSTKIDSHFAKQATLICAINQIALKIDKAAFKLLKCQFQKKKNSQKHQKKIKKQDKSQQNLNDLIQQLGQQKQGFQKRLQDLVLKRSNLVEEIKDKEWLPNEVAALFTHYRQKKIEVELEEIKLRESRLLSEKNQKDQLLALIAEEMKLRQSIIQQQKIIIQKNNIINRITYSRLNNSHLLPTISQRLQVPLQSSLFKQLSTQLSQSSLHNTKREQSMNNHLKNKSSKKIKREGQQKYASNYSIDKLQKIREKSLSPRVKLNKKQGEASKKKYQQFDLVYMQR